MKITIIINSDQHHECVRRMRVRERGEASSRDGFEGLVATRNRIVERESNIVLRLACDTSMCLCLSELHGEHVTHDRVNISRRQRDVITQREQDERAALKERAELAEVRRIRPSAAQPELFRRA